MRNFSFSVKPNSDEIVRILELKKLCESRGVNFSSVVVKALLAIGEDIINGKV